MIDSKTVESQWFDELRYFRTRMHALVERLQSAQDGSLAHALAGRGSGMLAAHAGSAGRSMMIKERLDAVYSGALRMGAALTLAFNVGFLLG